LQLEAPQLEVPEPEQNQESDLQQAHGQEKEQEPEQEQGQQPQQEEEQARELERQRHQQPQQQQQQQQLGSSAVGVTERIVVPMVAQNGNSLKKEAAFATSVAVPAAAAITKDTQPEGNGGSDTLKENPTITATWAPMGAAAGWESLDNTLGAWEVNGLVLFEGVLALCQYSRPGQDPVTVASGSNIGDRVVRSGFCIVAAAARAQSSPRNVGIVECREGSLVAWSIGRDPSSVLHIHGVTLDLGRLRPYPVPAPLLLEVEKGISAENPVECRMWGNEVVILEGILAEREYKDKERLFNVPKEYAPKAREMLLARLGVSDSIAIAVHPNGAVVAQGGRKAGTTAWRRGELWLTGLRWVLGEGDRLQPLQRTASQGRATCLDYLIVAESPGEAACRCVGGVVFCFGSLDVPSDEVVLPELCRPLGRKLFCVQGPEGPTWVQVSADGRFYFDPSVRGSVSLAGVAFLSSVAAAEVSPHRSQLQGGDDTWSSRAQVRADTHMPYTDVAVSPEKRANLDWAKCVWSRSPRQDSCQNIWQVRARDGWARGDGDGSGSGVVGWFCQERLNRLAGETLECLDLSDINITDDGAGALLHQLALVVPAPHVERLKLSWNWLTLEHEGGAWLQDFLHSPAAAGLRELHLSGNRISTRQAIQLVELVIKLPRPAPRPLFCLRLDRNRCDGALVRDAARRDPRAGDFVCEGGWWRRGCSALRCKAVPGCQLHLPDLEWQHPDKEPRERHLIYPSLSPRVIVYLTAEEVQELDKIRQFFQNHETHRRDEITHTTFLGHMDYFSSTGKWVFGDDGDTQATLFRSVARLLELGIPCFISERFSCRHPWTEDIDIVSEIGRQEDPPPTELVLDREFLFLRLRAQVLFELFPEFEELDVYVYNSSGWSKGKELHKVSYHFVWSDIIVNHENAKLVRQATLSKFLQLGKKGMPLFEQFQSIRAHAPTRCADVSDAHLWSSIFDENSVRPKNGLRMPYNEKADLDDRGKKRRDTRSPIPQCVVRFTCAGEEERAAMTDAECTNGKNVHAKVILEASDLTTLEWLRRGSCRRLDPELTCIAPVELKEPVLEDEIRNFSCGVGALKPFKRHAPELLDLGMRQLSDLWLLDEIEIEGVTRRLGIARADAGKLLDFRRQQGLAIKKLGVDELDRLHAFEATWEEEVAPFTTKLDLVSLIHAFISWDELSKEVQQQCKAWLIDDSLPLIPQCIFRKAWSLATGARSVEVKAAAC